MGEAPVGTAASDNMSPGQLRSAAATGMSLYTTYTTQYTTLLRAGLGGLPARTGAEELAADIQVTFARSGVTATWDPACETILGLAEQRGLSPAYSCRSGICYTCPTASWSRVRSSIIEERVDTPDAGSVLICCARPKGTLIVDV